MIIKTDKENDYINYVQELQPFPSDNFFRNLTSRRRDRHVDVLIKTTTKKKHTHFYHLDYHIRFSVIMFKTYHHICAVILFVQLDIRSNFLFSTYRHCRVHYACAHVQSGRLYIYTSRVYKITTYINIGT